MSRCPSRKRRLSDKLCECGCGEFTYLAEYSDKRRDMRKGEPLRALPGHIIGKPGPAPKVWDREAALAELLARGERRNDCLEWTGYVTPDGYGELNWSYWPRPIKAHRAVMDLVHGGIPEGACVLHHCDNRLCFDPEHLYFGTKKQNTHDMLSRGRHKTPRGEDHPHATLTSEQVADIRARHVRVPRGQPSNTKELAAEYGITTVHVCAISRGASRRDG